MGKAWPTYASLFVFISLLVPRNEPRVAWIARAGENERLDLKVFSDRFSLSCRLASRWSFWGAILQRAEGHIQVRWQGSAGGKASGKFTE
jgi:hypothetical protein